MRSNLNKMDTTVEMIDIIALIQDKVMEGVEHLYQEKIDRSKVALNTTRKEFEGDYTVVVFPFTKAAKKGPQQVGEDLGQFLVENVDQIKAFNVIKGFLNLVVDDAYWKQFLESVVNSEDYGQHPSNGKKIMVEFSSPNTNKPLHLGHIRNILLGWSCSRIFEAAGYDVIRTQIVNDRGIHICKSMVAWQQFGNGETPESTGLKGDHFVGKYYVAYNNEDKKQKAALEAEGKDKEETAIMKSARDLLQKWEANDEEVRKLWASMNGWVYEGFNATYDKLGVRFDKLYYESDTYLLGKDAIDKGLEKEVFYKKEDGSVWIDLEDAKLDHKLVLRSDGTSVYMTQDIGTASQRYDDYKIDEMVYVVGDEQNYHFKVLFEIMKRLEAPFANGLYHLSYGMVDLPTGRMKSREGTVVDADDLVEEVIAEAHEGTKERGDLGAFSEEEQKEIIRKIGMAALKYFIVKVNPQKRMVFDPKESVDLQGNTGPYIQYASVRINGVLQRAAKEGLDFSGAIDPSLNLETIEKDILLQIYEYPNVVLNAAKDYDPSVIASYCYNLAKNFNKFWHDHSIFNAETEAEKIFRLKMSKIIGYTLKNGMDLLGIEMPERM